MQVLRLQPPLRIEQENKMDLHPSLLYIVGYIQKMNCWDFPGDAMVENLPANAGDTGSSPGLGRSHML